ncbi:hypothetical protein [Haloparvum sedimenti]|uniref:hypothetical protein n=1 Tax=Haloparvum sedimenti TaxID=1678448 RepID=UPI00071E8AB3|nr:hypothetical protein [Haloparvum sedimenti]
MSTVPGDLSTDVQPPLAIPLRHFLVGLGFLFAGTAAGLWVAAGAAPPFARVATAHLLLVGWVAVTILGAVTQFVPVWSGIRLHSRRLASLQLLLVAGGVPGFAGALWLGRPGAGAPFALAMVLGVTVFVYNVARTLLAARPWDVTEAHFALALGFFAAAMTLATALALDFRTTVFPVAGITRASAIAAHATLAVLGGVLTTVAGALYQLGPMFTQSDPESFDHRLRRVESVALPVGVVLLAGGRLVASAPVATVGGALVATASVALGWFLLRRVRRATGTRTPMLPRYGVVALALVAWGLTAGAVWVRAAVAGASGPGVLAPAIRFGAPSVGPVLLFAAIGFVVAGTLYHVVPFLIWVHRYSDRVGLEPVPTIDDLTGERLARADLVATVGGSALVLTAATADLVGVGAPSMLALTGLALAALGLSAFLANLLRVVAVHAPDAAGLPARVLSLGGGDPTGEATDGSDRGES